MRTKPRPPAPFPRLYAAARRGDAADQRLLDELGAYYVSALIPPKRTRYSWEGGDDLIPRRDAHDDHTR